MAEETKKPEPAPAKAKSSWKKRIIVAVMIILAAAGTGFGTFKFFIAPKLADKPEPTEGDSEEYNPAAAKAVTFEKAMATVLMPPGDSEPASILMFQVSLECANEETKVLVDAHKEAFIHMINELHEFRNRDELNDRQVKQDIEKVALQKANAILKQLQEKPNPEIKITDVFHLQFVVQDQ